MMVIATSSSSTCRDFDMPYDLGPHQIRVSSIARKLTALHKVSGTVRLPHATLGQTFRHPFHPD